MCKIVAKYVPESCPIAPRKLYVLGCRWITSGPLIFRELPVNDQSAFLVAYLVKLPTSRLLARNNLMIACHPTGTGASDGPESP